MTRSSLLLMVAILATAPTALAAPRWFRVSITPFAYDISDESQLDTYARVNARQDMETHHVDDGVPWPEAYAGTPYHPAAEANIALRLANTPPGMKSYLAVTPLDSNRGDMAGYWSDSSNAPRPGVWADKDFDDPMVIEAYYKYCRDMVNRFHPTYFNYAIESLELARNAPARWPAFMRLLNAVYPRLKRDFPALPIFVSITLRDPGTPGMTDYTDEVGELMKVSDYMAVSTYRYLFGSGNDKGNPANLPPGWLQQAADLAPDKPFAIAETGWLAENLNAPSFGLFVTGTAAWQADYVRALFSECERLKARFVIWFLAVDYDRLWFWLTLLGQANDGWLLWRDTGLWNGQLSARPSLAVWDARNADGRRAVPPIVPDGWSVPGAQLTVARASGTQLKLDWGLGACPAPNHHVVWLDLHAIASYSVVGETCAVGNTGSYTGPAPAGDLGVLVVADDGASIEGSHGVDSSGHERPSRSTLCGLSTKLTDGVCP
ncbi:MAG: hypothetical protein U0V87_09825 [Acidobacteriota bacterium]